MKKFILSIVFCLAMSGFAFAQSRLPELEKIKQIKLLESTREDVVRIFSKYEKDSEGDKYQTENMHIHFFYASGDCTDEEEEWNVPEGKVIEIHVIFKDTEKSQGLKANLSNLERIKADEEDEEDDVYIYYDTQKGINYIVYEGEIGSLKFMPSDKNSSALCNNNNFRQFNLDSEWFRDKLRDRPMVWGEGRSFTNVDDLILSKYEITTAVCTTVISPETRSCSEVAEINVETKATSTYLTDVLTYNYTVSAGRIIGTGANVIWDLSGVKPGKYTITAGADNGCGVCGMTKTETVVVKDCPDCRQKDKK